MTLFSSYNIIIGEPIEYYKDTILDTISIIFVVLTFYLIPGQ